MKKNLVAFSLALLLSSQSVQASDYGLCINRSKGDWRKQVVCNQDETRRLMREINNTYAKLARDPHFNRLNTGKTSLNEQFKSWQEYRNSYCSYWEKAQCEELPYPLDVLLFDTAVNHGVVKAIKILQESLNIKADGVMGQNTRAAARTAKNSVYTIFMLNRLFAYTNAKSWPTFKEGWKNRLVQLAQEIDA